MASMSTSNHQHPPPTSAGDFAGNPPPSTSNPDQNSHLATSGYAPSENQLAGLVEAATAAAGQDVSEWAAAAAVAAAAGAAGNQHQLEGYGPDIHLDDDGFGEAAYGSGMGSGRQFRGASANEPSQSCGLTRTATKKRKRGEDPLDPALTASGAGLGGGHHQAQAHHQHQQHHPNHHPNPFGGDGLEIRNTPPQSLSDARAVGLHSAAALFRQPSSNKKYTRPPMSKLFSSLELSPENFLHLQAAAKAYMLDDRHPERRDCVGQRGKGDTEMVKLRLWNCVRHFLEVEGNGPRFFGEHVVNEGIGPRTYIWPRDQQKIISLVIPLLRRMVTNERQRQYAVETRKGGGTEERRRRKTEDSIQNFNSASPPKFTAEEHLQMHAQHHLPDEYTPTEPPLSAPPLPHSQPAPMAELGLMDLFVDGYTNDWNTFAKSYDMYNENYELDNLWSLSGLQLGDWRGLVAAVDSHYQVIHGGDYHCNNYCESDNVGRIVNSDATSDLRWRIGGSSNLPARNEFASSITRDVSRIIRDNLARHNNGHSHDPLPQAEPMPPPNFSHPSEPANTAPTIHSPLHLRINILQSGKRIFSYLDIPANQCPDIPSTKQLICRRYTGDPAIPSYGTMETAPWNSSASWQIKVWLPDGLTPIENDGDWTLALLSAEKVEWMDGELKVLIETEDTS
ncbi:hypothetical protein P175DRAFT_0448772 [Aspergillus ochraceoroseus IBT 24754]|uniref:Uncharacterized protein n=1 Tax=Aspergillus ochraceoroseus IBT 24754 TaxID=1392256 RepID=A0A2T5M5R3_9EURO|nr:uncharacterized protein P175DRAFT_0448772 [Aspergillus ochraceoroseus IBT 24754]PTU23873.1 hypothetical protein P175DRAFT_0448772 [Aspergillus ochraceoroseus IBT 24754]